MVLKKIVMNGKGVSHKSMSQSGAKNGVETFSYFHFRQVKFMFYIDDGALHCACPSHRSHCSQLLIPAMLENWSGERHLPNVIVFTTLNYRGWVGWKKTANMAELDGFCIKFWIRLPDILYVLNYIETQFGMFGGLCVM